MALSQFSGVTGVRRRQPYREIIEAGSERLPQMVREREQKAHREQMYGFEKGRQKLARDQQRTEKRMAEKAAYEARKQFKKQKEQANIQSGIAGLGVVSNLFSGGGGGGWNAQPVTSGVKKVGGGAKDLWGGVKNVFSTFSGLWG